jgi:DNA-binding NarL/FixJ family response regulator
MNQERFSRQWFERHTPSLLRDIEFASETGRRAASAQSEVPRAGAEATASAMAGTQCPCIICDAMMPQCEPIQGVEWLYLCAACRDKITPDGCLLLGQVFSHGIQRDCTRHIARYIPRLADAQNHAAALEKQLASQRETSAWWMRESDKHRAQSGRWRAWSIRFLVAIAALAAALFLALIW